MTRAALISLLLAAMLAASLPAFAQSPPAEPAPAETAPVPSATTTDTQSRDVILQQRWVRVLDRVNEQLKQKDLSPAVLSNLEQTVYLVRNLVDAAREPLQRDVDKIVALIGALGPPPKEGEQPETASVAAQRLKLTRQLIEPEGRLKQLDVIVERANLLARRIVDARAQALADQLLVRTPSLLSSESWARAAAESAAMARRVLASPRVWYESRRVRAKIGTGYYAGAILAVIAVTLLGWYLRGWLMRRFGRKRVVEQPSYRMRVLAALAETTAHTTIPILVVAVAIGALLSRDLLFGVFQYVIYGIFAAVILFSVLNGLLRVMLSPGMPNWRLTHIGDVAARLWYYRVFALAVLLGIDVLVAIPFNALDPSDLLRSAYVLIAGGAASAVFLAIVFDKRLWLTPQEEAHAAAINAGETPGPPPEDSSHRSRWWLVGRVAVTVLALAIPITALAGYGVLSEYISRRLVATMGVFLFAILFFGLARDLVAVFTREDDKRPATDEAANPIYVWSVFLLDIGLFVTIVFFLVPLWGGRWESILERIGVAMSGFKIGGRTFSLGDVLMGMIVFVILIVLVRFIRRFLDTRILRQMRVDVGVRNALNTGIGYVGVVIAALIGIHTAGIDLSGLAIIAGALSVGIGFGMQNIVNNFISGLILLIERPIKVGDWIVVGEDEGHVKRISVRSTEIQSFSNASVIVPNAELIAGRVKNWMHKDRSGRIELPVGVAYGSDTAKVREVLLECIKDRDGVNAWPQPQVLFMDFGDSALLFQLRFFIRDVDRKLSIASEIRFAIDHAFREAGIVIPFPQRDVHVIQASEQANAAEPETEDKTAPDTEPDTGPTAPADKILPIRASQRADAAGRGGDSQD